MIIIAANLIRDGHIVMATTIDSSLAEYDFEDFYKLKSALGRKLLMLSAN